MNDHQVLGGNDVRTRRSATNGVSPVDLATQWRPSADSPNRAPTCNTEGSGASPRDNEFG